jgi:hypothetical protein
MERDCQLGSIAQVVGAKEYRKPAPARFARQRKPKVRVVALHPSPCQFGNVRFDTMPRILAANPEAAGDGYKGGRSTPGHGRIFVIGDDPVDANGYFAGALNIMQMQHQYRAGQLRIRRQIQVEPDQRFAYIPSSVFKTGAKVFALRKVLM